MRAVAEQADVALGTLYRYFPSKIHLLVSALGRAVRAGRRRRCDRKPIPGDTAADRVDATCSAATTRGLQRDPHLTEALTRAFMFADASVASRDPRRRHAAHAGCSTAAMHPGAEAEPTEDEIAIAR